MNIRIDKESLDSLMKERGIANYQELAKRATAAGHSIGWRTIYDMINDDSWSARKLKAVCVALDCKPSDIIPEWEDEETETHTQDDPQPGEVEAQQVGEPT